MIIPSLILFYRKNPEQFLEILNWYLFPVRYAHPERFADTFKDNSELVRRLSERSSLYARAFSRIMLRLEGLDRDKTFNIPDSLVFLNSLLLERLFFLLGLTVSWRSIAKEILGERVRKIKAILSEEGYRFVLKKAPFLFTLEMQTGDEKNNQETLLIKTLDDIDNLPKTVTLKGMAIFKEAVEPLSIEDRTRLRLKLSPFISKMWDTGVSSPIPKDEALSLIKRIIKSERGGNWAASM